MPDRALITMDDLEVAVPTNAAFEAAGYETTLVSAQDDHGMILRKTKPDVVILTGALHEHLTTVLVALAREHATSTLAVLEETEPDPKDLARALGVTAFAVKPVEPDDMVALAGRLIARRRLQERTGIIGESAAVQQVLVQIEQMAPVSSTVLIEGESGTGKELVAQAIHDLSPRRDKPFIAINCAALPDSLLESELFGHEKGAFTGAAERRLGRFELADSGTLFLDEIGEMRVALQVKLLRVLESRSFFRVGGSSAIRVDVRVIAATNRGIREAVALGEFRDDLFFRLNVLNIYLPPLRERKVDIPILVARFVSELAEQHGRSFHGITPEAVDILVNAHWPGNVRELRNLIESMVVLSPGRQIEAADIPADVREGGTRLLPARVSRAPSAEGQGQELRFIFQSLVELKMQIEALERRMDGRSTERVEVVEVGKRPEDPRGEREIIQLTSESVVKPVEEDESVVVYRPGMKMHDVERAAIVAVLAETGGNRRRAAERLGIGERTLYRKIKEFGLMKQPQAGPHASCEIR